jgi:hypothetical protein
MSGKGQGWITDNAYRLIQQLVLDEELPVRKDDKHTPRFTLEIIGHCKSFFI